MDAKMLKIVGVGCLVLCVVMLFVAWERYNTNAQNVRAMKQITGNFPMQTPFGEIQPVTPAATKYALFFAGIFLIGGVGCFIYANKMKIVASEDRSAGKVSSGETGDVKSVERRDGG